MSKRTNRNRNHYSQDKVVTKNPYFIDKEISNQFMLDEDSAVNVTHTDEELSQD